MSLYTELLLASSASLYRMATAYILSVILSLILGSAMARNKIIESILLPVLDILQSIPILGFFPAALLLFVTYLPERIGLELASIFLIITSLVWNMIFGVYSSVKSLDPAYEDLARVYGFGHAARFFFIYTPASRRSLIANSLVSWAGGWFFLTSAEVVSLGNAAYKLVGLGSFTIEHFNSGDMFGFSLGVATLLTLIILTYMTLWNPAAATTLGLPLPGVVSFYEKVHELVAVIWRALTGVCLTVEKKISPMRGFLSILVKAILGILVALVLIQLGEAAVTLNIPEIMAKTIPVFQEIPLTLARIASIVMFSFTLSLFIAYFSYKSLIIGKSMSIIGEALASLPAIVWWPLLSTIALKYSFGPYLVSAIVFLQGSFWYLYFNVLVYGLASIKREFEELSSVYRIRGFSFFRYVFIPSLLPSVATGALSAWGGAWNASVVAEYVSIENKVIDLGGVGALLNKLTINGDATGLVLSAVALSLVIVLINKTFWSRVFNYLEGKYGGEE
ncbi:MAG: ABC transporter permease subunit [Infirmifilum sp.]